jgi:hypothetical protein
MIVSNCIEDKLNIYLKLFALLYADDTVLMAETHDEHFAIYVIQ